MTGPERPAEDNRRRRADAFRTTGEEYHRLRPGYPDVVVDWMLPEGARTVLDLGAGTGRLTDALVARGLDVWAVDPSASMLDVLRRRHPDVHVVEGVAERTGLPDASVDAIVIGQAWHWMDAEAASAEAARILLPGGTLAMAWNQREVGPGWEAEFHAVQYGRDDPESRLGLDLVTDDDLPRPPFGPREVFTTRWSRTVPAADHLALYTTHSPFLVAEEAEQARRLRRWRELLAELDAAEVVQTYVARTWRFRLGG